MNPIEAKVIAAIAGGGLGGAIGQFLLWLLGVLVWHASSTADKATVATAAVPEPVSMLLVALVAAGGAGLAGYSAPHTSRPATPVTLVTPTPVVTPVNGMSTSGNTPAAPPQPTPLVGPPAA
jgi:hypothetical protein